MTMAIALTTTGCGPSGTASAPHTAAATPDAAATVDQASPATGSGGGTDQAQVLAALPKRPTGTLPWDKAKMANLLGILTPEQFIEADYKSTSWSDERGVQNRRGLQYAARQAWIDPAQGTYVDTFIIHYASEAGAQSDYLAQVRADAKDYDAAGSFSVPAIAQSKVFVNHPGLKPRACGSLATGCGVGDRVQNSNE